MRVFIALLCFTSAIAQGSVRVGAERLFEAPYRGLLEGKRVGVLSHAASRLSDGTHLVDNINRKFKLTAIFSPEHGFRGGADEAVGDSRDPATGVQVFSLFGPRRAPTPEQLALIDVLVIDLQDVGIRFYTYPGTMAWTLEACARAGKPVVVLDRPEIAGRFAEGAVLELHWQGSMTSFFPTTTIHGMTMGELARLFNGELHIGADVTVVPLEGWRRDMTWEETGVKWLAPSPALATSEQALLYTMFGPLETLNIAVGRGVDNREAFRVYGAPWINSRKAATLVTELRKLALPGLSFSPAQWVPDRREFKGRLCRGFRVTITEQKALQPFRSLLAVLGMLEQVLAPRLKDGSIDHSIGARWVREELERGESVEAIVARAAEGAAGFLKLREKHLLYR